VCCPWEVRSVERKVRQKGNSPLQASVELQVELMLDDVEVQAVELCMIVDVAGMDRNEVEVEIEEEVEVVRIELEVVEKVESADTMGYILDYSV